MGAFVVRRLLQAIPTVLGVALLTFLLFNAFGPDPVRTALGAHATPEAMSNLRHQWGLDQSLAMQFVDGERPDCRHIHVTFADNPWFPVELDGERVYLQGVDADAYAHVWLGATRTHSDAQVFRAKYEIA